MGARARRLSHGVHASAITQGGTCIRGKGTSSDPGSCWRASKGVTGDAGIGGDEGDTASWGDGGSDRNATVRSTDSAHKAPLPLPTAQAAVRPPSLMLAAIVMTPRGTHAAAAVTGHEQTAARHRHATAVMTLTAPSDDDADRGAEDVNRDGEGDAGGSGG